jgi:hypothetical protein
MKPQPLSSKTPLKSMREITLLAASLYPTYRIIIENIKKIKNISKFLLYWHKLRYFFSMIDWINSSRNHNRLHGQLFVNVGLVNSK